MGSNGLGQARASGGRRRASGVLLAASLLAGVLALVVGAAAAPTPAEARPSSGLTTLSGGTNHFCGITTAGGVRCWGTNDSGQLGIGIANLNVPTDVPAITSGATSISAGGSSTCAVVSHAAKCWGGNASGQLGNGTAINSTTPVTVTGLSSGVVGVTVSKTGSHACALLDTGGVKCWGANDVGQLGNATTTLSSVPVDVVGLSSGVTQVTAGQNYTCALLASGTVKCWGSGAGNRNGDGTFVDRTTPVTVPGITGATAIDAGQVHTCAIATDGVYCWGGNIQGQLGGGNTATATSVVKVVGLSTGVTAIGLGLNQSCAVVAHAAKCWGSGAGRAVGDGTNSVWTTPFDVVGASSGVVDVTGASNVSCALMSTGAAQCWGDNTNLAMGTGEGSGVVWRPLPWSGEPATAADVYAGGNVSCLKTQAGALRCAGSNSSGQLGIGSLSPSSSSLAVARAGATADATSAAAAANASCAVVAGAVQCAGLNTSGQMGNGTSGSTFYATPETVTGLSSGAKSVAVGQTSACALLDTGGVKCWGLGTGGQLGTGSTTASFVPTDVVGLTSGVTAISALSSSYCALLGTGGVKCWGLGSSGQLGTGTTSSSPTPVDVSGLTSGVKGLAKGGGSVHMCAVLDSGAIKCWGSNAVGQLGNSSTTSSSTPVAVTGLGSGVTAAAVGGSHTCAIVSGAAKCWGAGSSGRLGNLGTTNQTAPVNVAGLSSNVTAIAAGTSHSCAVAAQVAYCWGSDLTGQLGSGSVQPVIGGAQFAAPASNTAPEVTGASHDVQRGVANAITFNLSATDAEHDTIDGSVAGTGFTKLTNPAVGTLTCTAAGACTYSAPAGTPPGSYTFTWNVSDGTDTSATATETLVVGNTTPVALPKTVNDVQRGRPAAEEAFQLDATDLNGDPLLYEVVDQPSVGTLDCSAAGACTYAVPAGTPTGDVTFTFRADDGQGPSNTATVTLGIANMAPVANNVGPLHITAGGHLAVDLDGTDANGDTLTYDAPVDAPTKGSVTGAGATRTYEPDAHAKGPDSFTYTASDDAPSTSNPGTVSIVIDNTAPTADARTIDVSRGVLKSFHLTGSDVDGDDLTFAIQANVTKGTLDCGTDGACTYRARPGETGVDSFEFVANDGTDNSTAATVTFAIANQAPSADEATLDAPRGVGTHVVLHASDPNSDQLAYEVVDQPAKGTLDCNGSAGEDCVYTAGANQTGTDAFTFRASDGIDTSNTATVSITITNQAPVADEITTSAARGVDTEVVLTASDPNGNPTTFAKASDPTKGTVTCATSGVCTYHAGHGTSGDDTFTYTASDGDLVSDPATVTVHITNQAPVADPRSIDVGHQVATPIVLSGIDPNGDDLTFAIDAAPTKGTLTCDPGDSSACTYTSAPGARGADSFTYVASDGDLGSAPATISITIVSAGPTANAQSLSAPRGTSTPITLSGADPEGDATTFAIATTPTKGTLTCTGADGSTCTYEPGVGKTGTDTFTYAASDGTDTSAPATVTITITNQAPLANAQTVSANAPLVATPITLTGTDPNGDALTYAVATSPAKGLLSCTDADCTYTTAAGKTGTDTFTFEVTDIEGATSTATITVRLDNVTPGLFLGKVEYLEPESGAVLRGPFVPVILTEPAVAPVTVWYYTVDGTAVTTGMGGDYRQWGTAASPRSLTIPTGATIGFIQPPVNDDDLVEPTEDFQVRIASLSGGASYLGEGRTQVDIVDADSISVGKPILSNLEVTYNEGNSGTRMIGFRVALSKVAAFPVTVTCSTVAGTALPGIDYKAATKTATITAGNLSTTIDILTYPNAQPSPDRTFDLACSLVGSPAVSIYNLTSRARILDED